MNLTGPYFAFTPEVVRSRGILLDTLAALSAHRESLTVVGAHAVYERTKHLTGELEMDATRDADVGVFPELLAAAPLLADVMDSLGLEPASPARPGVWGLKSESGLDLHERLTIDLIAPDALAGRGRRSADVGVHGKTVSRTKGTELTLIDRDLMLLDTFGEGQPFEAYVAGPAALIAAKAWKLHDRLDPAELARNSARLRPKDAGDLWRLLAVTDPADIREMFTAGEKTNTIGEAVHAARNHVEDLLTGEDFPALATAHFSGRFDARRIQETITGWLEGFR